MTAPTMTAGAGTDAQQPRPKTGARRIVVAVALGLAFVLIIAIAYAVTRTPAHSANYLSPTSGSPDGSRALVNVLRDQGVTVLTPETLRDVQALGSDPTETTLMVYDDSVVLGSDQRQQLLEVADRIIVVDPYDSGEFADYAPGVELETSTFGTNTPADCAVPAVEKAESIRSPAYLYDTSGSDSPAIGCFAESYPDEEGGTHDLYSVVQVTTDGTEVTIVGVGETFTNGTILAEGNAAFALNLLGHDETLIWYRPGFADLESGDVPTLQNLTPPWVTPVIVLLLLVVLAAGIWRGRRVGPLVTEKLPVIVRANETMEGRARLYERAGAREHALDSLRIGTIARLAVSCGLPKRSTVDEVVLAVSSLTGRPRADIAALLVDGIPANDGALVKLSDALLVLEDEVSRITRGR
jgi:hypothetical protein